MFSAAEEERLRGFPEIGLDDLIQFVTLTAQDHAFVETHRGAGNRLGIAVQLCTLPWLGFVPDDVAAAPAPHPPGARRALAPGGIGPSAGEGGDLRTGRAGADANPVLPAEL